MHRRDGGDYLKKWTKYINVDSSEDFHSTLWTFCGFVMCFILDNCVFCLYFVCSYKKRHQIGRCCVWKRKCTNPYYFSIRQHLPAIRFWRNQELSVYNRLSQKAVERDHTLRLVTFPSFSQPKRTGFGKNHPQGL